MNKSRSNIQERAGTEDARAAAAEKEEEEEDAREEQEQKEGGSRRRRTFLNGFWAVQRRFLQDPIPPMLATPTMIQEMPRGEEK